MVKFFTSHLSFPVCIAAVCAVLLCGCRSDRVYQNRAAEKARTFLLENAPELNPQQVAFVKYNDPFLMTADGLDGKNTGVKQICIAWSIPDADTLYMVFGVSRERMDDWYPNRLIKRNYVAPSPAIKAAVTACRNSAVTSLRDTLSKEDLNIIRLSAPEIAVTDFQLRPENSIDNPNDMSLNKFEVENPAGKTAAAVKAPVKMQISLIWKISEHRYAVFCGTAANESLSGWKINFAGIISDHETNAACRKFLKKADDYDTPVLPSGIQEK